MAYATMTGLVFRVAEGYRPPQYSMMYKCTYIRTRVRVVRDLDAHRAPSRRDVDDRGARNLRPGGGPTPATGVDGGRRNTFMGSITELVRLGYIGARGW